DAADQQRNARDCAHHDIEYALGSLVLFQQLSRNDDREIIFAAMSVDQNLTDQNGTGFQGFGVFQLDDYFVQFRLELFELKFLQRGCQRNINVVAEILQFDPFEFVLGQRVVFHHTDYSEPQVIDSDAAAKRKF